MVKRQNASTGEFVDDVGLHVPGDQSKTSSGRPTMRLKVQAPYRVYYDDNVYSVSAENATGPFDILPRHHNFISILKAGELKIDGASAGQQKIIISGGLMRVESDQVVVFLDV